jgi:hypothetical protein
VSVFTSGDDHVHTTLRTAINIAFQSCFVRNLKSTQQFLDSPLQFLRSREFGAFSITEDVLTDSGKCISRLSDCQAQHPQKNSNDSKENLVSDINIREAPYPAAPTPVIRWKYSQGRTGRFKSCSSRCINSSSMTNWDIQRTSPPSVCRVLCHQ